MNRHKMCWLSEINKDMEKSLTIVCGECIEDNLNYKYIRDIHSNPLLF